MISLALRLEASVVLMARHRTSRKTPNAWLLWIELAASPGQPVPTAAQGETACFLKNIYFFLAALGLHCCVRAFSSCGERGLLFLALPCLVAEHGL